MPNRYPRECRDDVVAVARKGEAPLKQVAKDFRISESSLGDPAQKAAEAEEDGKQARHTQPETAVLAELRKHNRLLEQENEVLRRPRPISRATSTVTAVAGRVRPRRKSKLPEDPVSPFELGVLPPQSFQLHGLLTRRTPSLTSIDLILPYPGTHRLHSADPEQPGYLGHHGPLRGILLTDLGNHPYRTLAAQADTSMTWSQT